jgi:hypothetical protein
MFVEVQTECEQQEVKVKDVETGKTDNKKAPRRTTATAGAKEIKVPYLFDERFGTVLPRLHLLLRATTFKLALPLDAVIVCPTLHSNNSPRPTLTYCWMIIACDGDRRMPTTSKTASRGSWTVIGAHLSRLVTEVLALHSLGRSSHLQNSTSRFLSLQQAIFLRPGPEHRTFHQPDNPKTRRRDGPQED